MIIRHIRKFTKYSHSKKYIQNVYKIFLYIISISRKDQIVVTFKNDTNQWSTKIL